MAQLKSIDYNFFACKSKHRFRNCAVATILSMSFVLCQKVKFSVTPGCNKQYQKEIIIKEEKKKNEMLYETFLTISVSVYKYKTHCLFQIRHLKMKKL